MIWSWYKALKAKGIVGMNQRNADYVSRYNPRKFYPLVDNKLLTKQLALQANISVPELYGVVEIERQIVSLPALLDRYDDFVIKPAQGCGGDGILVITGKINERYRKSSGQLMESREVLHHVSNILSGVYSLGGHADKALIEYRVKSDPIFKTVNYNGVPDIRMLVFQGYPVMAMVRLPTQLSDSKANLHQGAVGAGIDIVSGITTCGVFKEHIVTEHPDTGASIIGIPIPQWNNILALSARCYELTQMGYIGVDIVLDETYGPLVLELNARPGLAIQIANQQGLESRLNIVKEEVMMAQLSLAQRLAFVKERFR